MGWWNDSATKVDKDYLTKYLNTDGSDIAWDFIRSAYSSVSKTSIVLIQVMALHLEGAYCLLQPVIGTVDMPAPIMTAL